MNGAVSKSPIGVTLCFASLIRKLPVRSIGRVALFVMMASLLALHIPVGEYRLFAQRRQAMKCVRTSSTMLSDFTRNLQFAIQYGN